MKGARPIKASKGKNYRGKFPSRKVGQMIYWESLLERDYIRILEFDPEVKYFESQPLVIPYLYQGRRHEYFPDFKVITRADKIKLVEVKPNEFLQKDENRIKYNVGIQYCEQMGWTYHVATEDNIRRGYLQSNLKKILEVDFDEIKTKINNAIIRYLNQVGPVQFLTVINNLKEINHQELYIHIYYLIYTHQIFTELIDLPLSENSILEINNEGGYRC